MELCRLWNWYSPVGQMKNMACRDLLLKLERQGRILLPRKSSGDKRGGRSIIGKFKDLLPLRVELVEARHPSWELFKCLLSRYHYLVFDKTDVHLLACCLALLPGAVMPGMIS